MEQVISDYLGEQQAARQWKPFLGALAEEFGTQLEEPELRALMQRLGSRFAEHQPLPACQTLTDMQQAMSQAWFASDWGWTELEEHADHLLVRHYCSPLRAAFGERHQRWTPAFLEGAYQQWFHNMGSGSVLRLQQSSELDRFGCVEFRLAQ